MNKRRIAAAMLFCGVGMSAATFAQNGPGDPYGPAGPGRPDDHGMPQQRPVNPDNMVGRNGGGVQNPNYARPAGNPAPQHNSAPQHNPGPQYNTGRPPMQADQVQRGNGPRDWRKGDRLPSDYRNRQYVVDDYRGYGLRQPPRGYQWVGVSGDYALVAISSGVIAQIVISGR
ncbi:RcnB family protein [Caballeronia sp.]|uniref:RcnB family protein n=1 Tax=Caballeronia sp. TaxID=1931223 RepID=UPI003C509AAA